MRIFKVADCIVQFIILAIVIAFCLSDKAYWDTVGGKSNFFWAYYLTGSWQLLSTLIHILNPVYNNRKSRRIYTVCLLVIAGTALLGFILNNVILPLLMCLLFIGPLMAIHYCIICTLETKIIQPA